MDVSIIVMTEQEITRERLEKMCEMQFGRCVSHVIECDFCNEEQVCTTMITLLCTWFRNEAKRRIDGRRVPA